VVWRSQTRFKNIFVLQFYLHSLIKSRKSLIHRCFSNVTRYLNQIAKRVNSGGHAYREDIAHVDSQLTECRELFGQIMVRLAKM
jgi:hypothetical protein